MSGQSTAHKDLRLKRQKVVCKKLVIISVSLHVKNGRTFGPRVKLPY